ncbi:tripartite tricarboxylate transporter substrate binding protein [Bordetella sp. FB-8]|uniref:Bug family tripartite tricarboxylate transporter substrate binding protein n=1 Tax=Bordetella sp. FB-8 TaxID=1159870 RepID=UPI00036EA9DD|nr:tripartite tricarboxylate transporter substrate binding protein [Bordetella sp. FB-8]
MRNFLKAIAFVVLFALGACAQAQDELSHGVITVIAPFPPGGGTDLISRLVSRNISKRTGWNLVVENKPGAGGNVALFSAAQARPDGHTLVMVQTDNIVLNPWLYRKLGYDTFKSFQSIGLVASSASVFVVAPNSPFKTLADVVAAARKKPGSVTFGIPGIGGSGDLLGHMWEKAAGMKMTHVPYRGWSQAYPDLNSGLIQVYTGSVATLLPQIQSGQVRAIGVVDSKRSPSLPNVPTFAESGFQNMTQPIWWGLMAPAHTPDSIVKALNVALRASLSDPAMIKRLEAAGYSPMSSSPAEMDALHRKDNDLFGKLVQEAGIKPQ